MTTWASSAARCSGERSCGSSTLVSSGPCRAWARSRRTAATSWACTAAHSWRPRGSSGEPSGARNSSCSYLARIHDSRSSLQDQDRWEGLSGPPPAPRVDPLGSPPICSLAHTARSPAWAWLGPACCSPTRGWPYRCQLPSAPGSAPEASRPSPASGRGTGACPGSGECRSTRCR